MSSMQDTDVVSTISSSFPTFVNPTSTSSSPETEGHMPSAIQSIDEWQDILGTGKSNMDKMSTLNWNDDGETKQAKSEYEFANEDDEIACEIETIGWAPKRANQSLGGMPFKRRPPLPGLAPAIWRIILFQIAYCAVQVLTCLSTIVDVIQHRSEPTSFGTQHVSLLLSVWGPVFVFGHLPAVRRQLAFWRVVRRTTP
ncbi:hypothetical protein BDQ17DRAFT_762153 [Cyathus striatus]|nr:hypothetical protein BDQ17DRAFT_762153 [Cyathus striatus]